MSSKPARMKRYETDTSGSTSPNWNLMANQVDPQIKAGKANNMYCRVVT